MEDNKIKGTEGKVIEKIETSMQETMKKIAQLEDKKLHGDISEIDTVEKDSEEAKDKLKTLRLIKAELIRKNDNNSLYHLEVIQEGEVLLSMIEQREKSIDAYSKGNREDLADIERKEIELIKEFMPQMPKEPSIEEIREFVNSTIDAYLKEVGEDHKVNIGDMKNIMPKVKAAYPKAKGDIVKDELMKRM